MVAEGKTVVVPRATNIGGAVLAEPASKKYRTKSLFHSKVQLAEDGVGVVLEMAKILNKRR
jgi:hypothetical protein